MVASLQTKGSFKTRQRSKICKHLKSQLTMTISTFRYKAIATCLFMTFICHLTYSQNDSTFIRRIPVDSSTEKMNMDASYNRPFLTAEKIPIAIGGYVEANTQYES